MHNYHFLRKKNTETTIRFTLRDRASPASDMHSAVGPLAAADCQYSLDGGALGNTANAVAESPAGGAAYSLVVAAAELNGSICVIKVIDAAGGPDWEEVFILIETYDIYPNPLLETEAAEIVAADLAATMPFDKILGFLKNRFLMKTEMTAAKQTVYKADNATVVMEPAVSYDGVTQTRVRGY